MDAQAAPKDAVKTGTTTLAMACSDGVVMATEKRATMGHLVSHKNTQKLFSVDDHLALTTAGLVGDAQMIARNLSAQAQLYKFKRDAPMPVRGAATLLGNLLNGSKFQPYWVQLIVGGYDDKGGSIYSIDSAGGAIPEAWTVTGSGSAFVYGVLEDRMGSRLGRQEGDRPGHPRPQRRHAPRQRQRQRHGHRHHRRSRLPPPGR